MFAVLPVDLLMRGYLTDRLITDLRSDAPPPQGETIGINIDVTMIGVGVETTLSKGRHYLSEEMTVFQGLEREKRWMFVQMPRLQGRINSNRFPQRVRDR